MHPQNCILCERVSKQNVIIYGLFLYLVCHISKLDIKYKMKYIVGSVWSMHLIKIQSITNPQCSDFTTSVNVRRL